jgi:tripartite-type tricarboxylate transporter receptor subunit TctC
MKKVVLAVAVMCLASLAQAKEVISIVWPFGLGDTQAQYSRSLVEVLNQQQNKYTFILENKPGAGASIGARYVVNTPNKILATSTAFFVRPNIYPNESHRVEDFRPLMTQCAAPMLIVSNKYKSWEDIDKQKSISIGISGLGATSHLMAMQIIKHFPNALPIPYKGTREAGLDTMNGTTDMNVAFLGEVEGLLDTNKLTALGVTGMRSVRNIPTLQSQGFDVGEMVNMHSLEVPKTMSDVQYNELRAMVVQAAKDPSVQQAYKVDYCESSNLTLAETNKWFVQQISLWKKLSKDVSISTKK